MRPERHLLCLVLVLGLLATSVQAEPDPAATGDEADLRLLLDEARQEIRQLRTEVDELKQGPDGAYRRELGAALSQVDVPAAAADQDSGSFKLPAGWTFKPYGYIKGDISYDDSAVTGDNGNYVVWVNSENDQTRSDDRFSVTARETRLGFDITAPDYGDLKISGRAEIDFENTVPATNENKGSVQLRHAYGQLLAEDWSLLFGQASDVVSPLVPTTLNYTVGWFAGNLGYRHPQLRFSKWWQCPDEGKFTLQTSLTREIRQDAGTTGVDDGQDTGPTLMGRVSYSTPFAGKRLEAGVSAHWGKEEIDWDYVGDDDDVHTWSVNADLVVPICDQLEAKGEFFYGENIDSIFGGIGQGVNTTTREEIASVGGWFQLGYKPTKAWAFHGGAGMDNPRDNDLSRNRPQGQEHRSNNCFVFGNAVYSFTDYLSTGVELSYWKTDYLDGDDGDNMRIQHSWRLSF